MDNKEDIIRLKYIINYRDVILEEVFCSAEWLTFSTTNEIDANKLIKYLNEHGMSYIYRTIKQKRKNYFWEDLLETEKIIEDK